MSALEFGRHHSAIDTVRYVVPGIKPRSTRKKAVAVFIGWPFWQFEDHCFPGECFTPELWWWDGNTMREITKTKREKPQVLKLAGFKSDCRGPTFQRKIFRMFRKILQKQGWIILAPKPGNDKSLQVVYSCNC